MSETERRSELGELKIANDVVGIIAGLATVEIPGVAGMSGGSPAASQKCSVPATCPRALKSM